MRVDVWPVDGGPCPAKDGGVIIGPTLVPVAADRVLPLLREKQRGYHAYIRHLDLNSFPDVADRLPLKRAKQLCGPRIKSANLGSATGACSRCTGTATTTCCCNWKGASALLLPPAVSVLGFRRFRSTPGASRRTNWKRSVAADLWPRRFPNMSIGG